MPRIWRMPRILRAMRNDVVDEKLTGSVIGAFFEVYNTLGFGFLEGSYVTALNLELTTRGHAVRREAPIKVFYKGHAIGNHRVDLLVDGMLVVEVKSTAVLPPAAARQLFNYLRASGLPVGLLLHFGPVPKVYRKVCSGQAFPSDST